MFKFSYDPPINDLLTLPTPLYTHSLNCLFRRLIDFKLLNQELTIAPWQVGDIFTSTDDQYNYWKELVESVVDQHAIVKRKGVYERNGLSLYEKGMEKGPVNQKEVR